MKSILRKIKIYKRKFFIRGSKFKCMKIKDFFKELGCVNYDFFSYNNEKLIYYIRKNKIFAMTEEDKNYESVIDEYEEYRFDD